MLAGIVQNVAMPLKVKIPPVSLKRPESTANLDWRKSYRRAYADWLGEYTRWEDDPGQRDENRYRRCRHGCLVATESGREANYCTGCLINFNPTLLRPLPQGITYLTKRGTIGRLYYPGDHEICPYNPRWRMRTAEAEGGYRRSGQKDGNAVLTFPKKPIDDEQDELEGETRGICFASLLRPFDSRPDDDAFLFQRRWFNPFALPVWADDTSRIEFAEVGRFATWSDFTESPEPEWEFTPSGRKRHKDAPVLPNEYTKLVEHFTRLREEGKTNLAEYRIRRPRIYYVFTVPPRDGDEEKWRQKYWPEGKRTPYVKHERKPWAEGWRTERKMRDLDARLELYQWGSHNEVRNIPQMRQATYENAHAAWLDERRRSGPVCKQQPAAYKTERRYLFPAPGPTRQAPAMYEPRQTYFLRKPVTGPSAASIPLPFPDRNPAPWCRV